MILRPVAVEPVKELKAIVFVGRKENRERIFFGWGRPADLLTAILNANPDYRDRYRRAVMIMRQLSLFGSMTGNESLMPTTSTAASGTAPASALLSLNSNVIRHRSSCDDDEAAMLAKITLDELQWTASADPKQSKPNLEQWPDRLTLMRLQDLFAPCLHTEAVDRNWPNAEQFSRFLESEAPYVALKRGGVYRGMLRTHMGARALIRELFRKSQDSSDEHVLRVPPRTRR